MSFLDTWKTSAGMVILGVIISYSIGSIASFFLAASPSMVTIIVVLLASAALCTFAIVYALVIYPSLFTETPALKSSATASFLNGFAGGIIFGPLWCDSLTKRTRGISQYVLVVLEAIGLVAALAFGIVALSGSGLFSPGIFQLTSSSSSQTATSATSSAASSTIEDAKRDIIKNPAKYMSSDKARDVVSSQRTYSGDWNSIDPAIKRISFGDMSVQTYKSPPVTSWYAFQLNDVCTTEEASEILEVAIIQMYGDYDKGQEVVHGLFSADRIEQIGRLLFIGPDDFVVDGQTYYCELLARQHDDGTTTVEYISISTEPQNLSGRQ